MGRSKPRRGLQNVRTQSSRRAIGTLQSPELYIMLTSLEMERSRRMMERDRLLERVAVLNDRLRAVELEQDDIRHLLALKSEDSFPEPTPEPRSIQNGGFTY